MIDRINGLGGELTEAVRRKPYAVVLLDEVEKAHRDVLNLLLQILDEGHVTDSQGRRVDFRNTILVMTSNLGAEALTQAVTRNTDGHVDAKTRMDVMEAVRGHFSPEFINRIDELVVFNRLTREAIRDIVELRLTEVEQRLQDRRISLQVTEAAKEWLAEAGYDPVYGARPLNRVVQRQVLNRLAGMLIQGEIHDNSAVQVDVSSDKQLLNIRPI